MGKLLLCSMENDYNKIKSSIKDFSENSNIQLPFGHISTFKKIRIETKNIYKNDNNFIAGVGTFFYKGKIDVLALKMILENFDDQFSFKKDIFGAYCIVIYINKKLYIIVDDNSIYNIYYYMENNRIILTNTYYHIAKCLDIVDLNFNNLMEQCFQNAILGNQTIFNKIYKLKGNEIIFFDREKWSIKNSNINNTIIEGDYWGKVKLFYEDFEKAYKNSAIFLTGGQDSRLNLALLLSLKIKPSVYYGIGNSFNTCTKNEDYEIVKGISFKNNLLLHEMNWKDNENNDDLNFYLERYGELFLLYRCNKNIFYEFENNIETDFLNFGYFGETYRNIESIENYKKYQFTLNDFVEDLYIDSKLASVYSDYNEYRNQIYNKLSEICKVKKIDINKITKDDFQKIHTEYRKRADTVMTNFSNMFFYSFPLLSPKQMTDTIDGICFDEKVNSHIIMYSINSLNKSLLEVPVFSHIKNKVINLITLELLDEQQQVMYWKDIIRKKVKNPKTIFLLRKIYYALKKDSKGLVELENDYKNKKQIKELLKKSTILDCINIDKMVELYDSRSLTNIYLMEYMYNDIKE